MIRCFLSMSAETEKNTRLLGMDDVRDVGDIGDIGNIGDIEI